MASPEFTSQPNPFLFYLRSSRAGIESCEVTPNEGVTQRCPMLST